LGAFATHRITKSTTFGPYGGYKGPGLLVAGHGEYAWNVRLQIADYLLTLFPKIVGD
jgi:hypothetical protein